MKELLLISFEHSLAITAIYISMYPDMIFGRLGYLFDSLLLPDSITKPLYKCLTCMGGIWSVIIWFLSGREWVFYDVTITMLMTITINKFICIILDKTTDYGC